MNHILAQSFAAQLVDLESRFIRSLQVASPESAFIHFVFAQLPEHCRPAALPPPVVPASITEGIAPQLATVGLLSAIGSSHEVLQLYPHWRTSFSRLQSKDPFPIDRQTFALRPIEFFGICVGARHVFGTPSNEATWLYRLLPEQRRQLEGFWPQLLSSAAAAALADRDDALLTVVVDNLQTDELSLLLWLRASQSFADTGSWRSLDVEELQDALLHHCAVYEPDYPDPARSAILYGTLKLSVLGLLRSELDERWQLGRARSDVLDLLTTIFRRFHRTARQILERHANRDTLEIKDEYDVQDLVHALLLLFFDDVRPEVWTPNYAGNSSRTDFILWKERVVVEIKMTRKTLDQQEVANQLIVDKERYKADPRCESLVCFVYDPEGWCTNPAALESDLAQTAPPVTRVVVFSSRR